MHDKKLENGKFGDIAHPFRCEAGHGFDRQFVSPGSASLAIARPIHPTRWGVAKR